MGKRKKPLAPSAKERWEAHLLVCKNCLNMTKQPKPHEPPEDPQDPGPEAQNTP